MTIKLQEERGKGTHGGPYVYLIEGDELVHVGSFATRKATSGRGPETKVLYDLPDEYGEKDAIVFDHSRSGISFFARCRLKDFTDGRADPQRCSFHGLLENGIEQVRGLRFQTGHEANTVWTQFERDFVPMVQWLKDYARKMEFECSFMGHARRVEGAYKNPSICYYDSMSLPDDKSRVTSLKGVRKWLYQLWVLALCCDGLGTQKFVRPTTSNGKPYWWIEQGSDQSTCVADTPSGKVTCWFEFQRSRGERWKRPDIMATRGEFRRTRDFNESGTQIDCLIECKEDAFSLWSKKVEGQVRQYHEYLQPKHLILASFEAIPGGVKEKLRDRGIEVIDELRLDTKAVNLLRSSVREIFVS